MIICNFKYKMCSERINPFTVNIYLNIRCLPPLTILFHENINKEHIQIGIQLQGEWPPPTLFHTIDRENFLTVSWPSYSTMLAVCHRITAPYSEKINSKQYKHAKFFRQYLLRKKVLWDITLCSLIESNEDFEEVNCSHPKDRIMSVQRNVPHNYHQLTHRHIWTDNILYYTFLHGITKQSNMHCIMTQEGPISHSTVISGNTFDMSWCVTVKTHSAKTVCTKRGIRLSLDTATTALCLLCSNVHTLTLTPPNFVLCKNPKYIHILYQNNLCSVKIWTCIL